jgi:transposase InsO family protein
MTRFIRKYVKACINCAFAKGQYGKKEGKLNAITKVEKPMHTLHVDHLGPFVKSKLNNNYILVVTDAFSKFVFAVPTRTVNSVETIRKLNEVFSMFGIPTRVVSDRGLAFTSKRFKEFSVEKQFKHILTAVATPRGNGQVERTNRTLLDAMRTTNSETKLWDLDLPQIVWGINNTVCASTKFAPFELMFGHKSQLVAESDNRSNAGEASTSTERDHELIKRREKAKQHLEVAAERMKSHYDKRRKVAHKYTRGDLVLWRQGVVKGGTGINHKIDPMYSGPYRVTKVLTDIDRYEITSVKGMKGYKKFQAVVAADALRPYRGAFRDSSESDSQNSEVERDDLIDLLES